ncbi:MAG: cupin domain-containing protein [Candidatus Brocadiae bacterium]|nr:cupin domain-containing protein [Candidatus Brocadiia bacterium]
MELLKSYIHPLAIPLPPDRENGWKPYPIFYGRTKELSNLSCHLSVLVQDCSPHPPHRHKHEEILILLDGEVDIILPDEETANKERIKRLKPGQFVYYPANFSHTLQTVSKNPAQYLMFKWHADFVKKNSTLSFGHFHLSHFVEDSALKNGFGIYLIFEGSTAYLRKFQCHISHLMPKSGYAPHSDDYEVAILVLEGEVETLGERVGPYGVIFYRAGEQHGMNNPGDKLARYIVFEFHTYPISHFFSFLAKIKDPKRWKAKFKQILSLFKKNLKR